MSDVKYYTVTQEREVKVAATEAIQAAIIGDYAFKGGGVDPEVVDGTILTAVRVRDIIVREDY